MPLHHDDYNLADFIRIASGAVKADSIITNSDDAVKLTPAQLSLNKLAALFLLTSQGMTMITEGQEFAEAKIISSSADTDDKQKGRLDYNSYNKDNITNYLNYKHAAIAQTILSEETGQDPPVPVSCMILPSFTFAKSDIFDAPGFIAASERIML